MSFDGARPVASAEGNMIERLDPRTRLVATLFAVVSVTLVHNLPLLGAALLGALVLMRLGRLNWTDLHHRLLHVEGFMLVLLALLPFTVPGESLFALGPIAATREGLASALRVAIKVNVCVLTVFVLIGSVDPVRISQAAESLGAPPKLASLFLFTVRYVSALRGETTRLVEAMRIRAFRPRSNAHSWRTYGNLAGMMLVRSLERARRVDEAMRCRGFTGRMPAAPLGAAGRHDLAFAAGLVCVMVGLLVMDHVI